MSVKLAQSGRNLAQSVKLGVYLSNIKLNNTFPASIIPAICLIGVCLSGCDKASVVACMIVASLFYGAMFAGVYSNHVDIGSNFSGKNSFLTDKSYTLHCLSNT